MPYKPEIGSRVKLITFDGSSIPPVNCDPRENYWELIGQSGQVVEHFSQQERALVVFENPVSNFNLYCHNQVPNSLRIKWADLERA